MILRQSGAEMLVTFQNTLTKKALIFKPPEGQNYFYSFSALQNVYGKPLAPLHILCLENKQK